MFPGMRLAERTHRAQPRSHQGHGASGMPHKKENGLPDPHAIGLVPAVITSFGLLIGFYSLVFAVNGRYELAALMTEIAVVFDWLDGLIARASRTSSAIGLEYDSLSDVTAFGVAPAGLVYIWALKPFGPWGATICGLYIVCAALRLARFNIQVGSVDKRRFVGLPVAGAAAVVAGVVLTCRYFEIDRPGVLSASMAPTTLVLACLMISRVPYPSFKSINLRRASVPTMIAMLGTLSLLLIVPQLAAFLLATGYLLSGPILMMRGERVELDVPGLWPVPKQYAGLRWRSDADHRDSARKLR
jgi:CDP-diacylglycerol--serine O-phosphatidyltransferase